MNSCWNNEKCYEYLCTLRNSTCAYYTFFSVAVLRDGLMLKFMNAVRCLKLYTVQSARLNASKLLLPSFPRWQKQQMAETEYWIMVYHRAVYWRQYCSICPWHLLGQNNSSTQMTLYWYTRHGRLLNVKSILKWTWTDTSVVGDCSWTRVKWKCASSI
jgi:hypothetical protein